VTCEGCISTITITIPIIIIIIIVIISISIIINIITIITSSPGCPVTCEGCIKWGANLWVWSGNRGKVTPL
jgi:hypothetical protein